MSASRSDWLPRFSLWQRAEHTAVLCLFVLLSITGFPQKFPDARLSRSCLSLFGSVETARLWHRSAGLVFALLLFGHLARAGYLVLTGRARPSMVPARKDFTDALITLRYDLGITEARARFDRFDYRQKFEYWGMVLGGLVMVVTGLLLCFPIAATRFLTGEIIPAAKVAHGSEGLMAFLIVITWHIFNAHLAPGIFPYDASIFTGRIRRARMEEEHPIELDRLQATVPEATEVEGWRAPG